MFTILELDTATQRPIRRIPVLYTTEREADYYAVILNRREEVAKLRTYVVRPANQSYTVSESQPAPAWPGTT